MLDVRHFDRLVGMIGELEPGTVSLVGAGPGDAALISVRGVVRLMQADVVLHDEVIGPELLDLCRPEANRIFVGKGRGEHVWTQDEINAALVRHARAGERVVRLEGGDPFALGRGGEECEYLAAAKVRYEVVPGITAALGASVSAGIPPTHRGLSRSFVLVTGRAGPDDPEQLDFHALACMKTIAFYPGMKDLAITCERLIEAGLDARTPAAVIHGGTSPQQRTIVGTVGDMPDRVASEKMDPSAMILIGQVVRLRGSIEWFENRPLHGQTIVVTRAADQAASLSGPLRAAGAEVIEAPTLELVAVDDFEPVDGVLRQLARYDWLVLTSVNGVDAMFTRLEVSGGDSRSLAGVKVAAIGPATRARLREHGIRVDLIPAEAVGESMAEALIGQGVCGKRILLPRADIARGELPAALREAGAVCDEVAVYRTVCPVSPPAWLLERFDRGQVDWVTLTSPSSLFNLVRLLGKERAEELHNTRLASIGPVTTRAIRNAGYTETVQAHPHDVGGLVTAILSASKR